MIKLECSLAKNITNCKLSTTRTVFFNGQKDEWSENSEKIQWDKTLWQYSEIRDKKVIKNFC